MVLQSLLATLSWKALPVPPRPFFLEPERYLVWITSPILPCRLYKVGGALLAVNLTKVYGDAQIRRCKTYIAQ